MCKACSWFTKLFGCKCPCCKKDEACQPITGAPASTESQPVKDEKNQ